MTSGNSNEKDIMFAGIVRSASNEAFLPIDIVVERAVKDLQDIRSKITLLFQDRPVNLEIVADYMESARAIYQRTIRKIRRHYQQTEEGLLVRQVISSEKMRDRYTQLSFNMHLRVYNFFTRHGSRKTLLLQNRDSRLVKIEDAFSRVTTHHKLVLADSGNLLHVWAS